MCKKFIYLTALVVLLSVAASASADLILHWKFDEGSGTTATDSSGNGHDGTIEGDPQWVAGQIGGALDFGGDGDMVVDADGEDYINGLTAITITMWIKSDVVGTDSGFIIFADPAGNDQRDIRYDADGGEGDVNLLKYGMTYTSGNEEDESPANLQTTDWQHVAVTSASGAGLTLYINGVLVIPEEDDASESGVITGCTTLIVGKGGKDDGATEGWDGLIDDVRIYDTALTAEEIQQVMKGIPPGAASDPTPADKATDVPRDVVLSWTPGEFAPAVNGHTVYLSESFNDVNDGFGGTTVSASSYDPGRLSLGATYYWRVDEVNAPPDSTVFPSEIWSFTIEPVGYAIDGANIIATASSSGQANLGPENTVNGSGLDENDLHSTDATDMWLSGDEPLGAWIQYELDRVYKLHEMWVWNSNQVFEGLFGFGFKDVPIEYSTNGADWTALADVPEFAKAPGTDG